MPTTARLLRAVGSRDVRRIFIDELGWDYFHATLRVDAGDRAFELSAAAEKRGVVALTCDVGAEMPAQAVRRRIEAGVARTYREHLVVFAAADGTQVWQWVKRRIDEPVVSRERVLLPGQEGHALADALAHLAFGLEEEERLTVTDVVGRLRAGFDTERVTQRFYEEFQDEHERLLHEIEGLDDPRDLEWYASLLLNRLMFTYFLQKKGFLDGDRDYLRTRLARVRRERGGGFISFYRYFLVRLFHEGFGDVRRTPELEALLGDVRYINGGLFDVHVLERGLDRLDVPDATFERIFDFFDRYTWVIDERPIGSEREINPDVLGYIFERYVNRREQGAYYTKEDVTGFMAGATVVVAYLGAVIEAHPQTLAALRHLLSGDPDRYIYPSVRHGDGEAVRLPTEPPTAARGRLDWRDAVRAALEDGRLESVDDLVTWNVDVRQLAQDHLESLVDPAVLLAAWRRLTTMTVIDPTCGSGAFLFAALRTLEPLYEGALERMGALLTGAVDDGEAVTALRAVLDEARRHRSRPYVVAKAIVSNNLYGVDLLPEATEICKLRLFLRLVAKLDTVAELEPLPDADFNIRAGNALVGFGTEASARELAESSGQAVIDLHGHLEDAVGRARAVAGAFGAFRAAQLDPRAGADAVRARKAELTEQLGELRARLDALLVGDLAGDELAAWYEDHAAFHWFAEFYDVMAAGGFDVVIGNPPYIARSEVPYEVRGFCTDGARDIYANVLERALALLRDGGRIAFIVPLSVTFSRDFRRLREVIAATCATSWFASFGRIPDALFSADVRVRNTIVVGVRGAAASRRSYTTQLHRWLTEYRPHLFETVRFVPCNPDGYGGLIPKAGSARLAEAFERALHRGSRLDAAILTRAGLARHPRAAPLYFKATAYNWLSFSRDVPPAYGRDGAPVAQTQVDELRFASAEDRDIAMLLLDGKWAFGLWRMLGDDFHVTGAVLRAMPLDPEAVEGEDRARLLALADELDARMRGHVSFKLNAGRRVGTYNLARCRDVTDRSDAILGRLMGLGAAWPDVELLYAETIKTGFDGEGAAAA